MAREMEELMRLRSGILAVLVAAAAWLGTGTTSAQDTALYEPASPGLFSNIEITVGLGIMDRGTTGIGDPLLGLGYDTATGATTDLSLRFYFDSSMSFMNHGILLRGTYMAGSSFGLGEGYGFATTIVDLAYVIRFHCPCISTEDRKWYASGFVGLTGMYADASTGAGPDGGPEWNTRTAASSKFDHGALGGVLGASFDLHVDVFVIGVTVDLREHYGVGSTPIARSFETGASLHFGADFEL